MPTPSIGRFFSAAAGQVLSRLSMGLRLTRPHEVRGSGQAHVSAGTDPGAMGRAAAAYRHEFDKWQGLIEFAMSDRSKSPAQRQAAVASLRAQQRAAASNARRRVMEEEKQKAKAAQRAARNGLRTPPAPR